MILRKPYAFLIKNFKRINFIMFIIAAFLMYYSNRIFSFYLEYEKKRTTFFSDDLVLEYIKPIIFILVGVFIIMTIVIFILMNLKKKPVKLYFLMFVYSILFIVFLFINAKYLNIIQLDGLEPKLVRIMRDINFLSVIIPFIFGMFLIVRAVGFDIKKFNFGEDIVELQIDITDNEEVELTSGINVDDLSGKSRKTFRELRYFYLENKGVIIGGFLIIILILFYIFYIRIQFVNKVYNENEVIGFNSVNLKVTDSYITDLNYKGENVAETGYTFVVIAIDVENISSKERKLSQNNFRLETSDTIYNMDLTRYMYFIDMGVGYNEQIIPVDELRQYIIVFKVKKEDLGNKLIFKYADTVTTSGSKVTINYQKINLKPTTLDSVTEIGNVELGNELYYGLSFLKETTLTIDSIDINTREEYTIDNVKSYLVSSVGKTILRINYEFTKDSSIKYITNFKDFFQKYGQLTYKRDNKLYQLNYVDVTPSRYTGNSIFLSINSDVIDAQELYLSVVVRDKKYIHSLK